MKKIFIMIAVAGVFAACNNQQASQTTAAAEVSKDTTGANYNVDTTASVIDWKIDKKGMPGHNGNVMLNAGSLNVKEGNIVSGNFSINFNTIKSTDVTDAEMNGKLVGHLKSPDFFNVAGFPTGKFEITSCKVLSGDPNGNTHEISGNLTIKDSVKNVIFPAKVTINGDELQANGTVILNRLQWGLTYNSVSVSPAALLKKLGDQAIKDELEIKITLKAKKG